MKNRKEKKISLRRKIENNSAITAIRQGLICCIPLIVIGSVALMFMSLPIPVYQRFINNVFGGRLYDLLNFVYSSVFNFYSVIFAGAVTICFSVKKQQKYKQKVNMGETLVLTLITITALVGTLGIQYDTFTINSLSNINTFMALFVSLISSNLFYLIKKKEWFKLSKDSNFYDSFYAGAIEGIVPAIIIVLFFAVLRLVFVEVFQVNNLQQLLEGYANNLIKMVDYNFGEGLIVVLLSQIMWFFGIHGNNILNTVIEQNFTTISSEVFNKTFLDVFVIIGGCGAILSLVIAILIYAKKKHIRNIGTLSMTTAVFNISEIPVFGIPVILNPTFVVPFICIPIFNYVVCYIVILLGWVPMVESQVEWSAPILINAYQATGSWRGILLQVFCIVIDVLVYKPFVELYENVSDKNFAKNVELLVERLKDDEENSIVITYTDEQDEIGRVARILATELEEAIEKRKLFLLYQPQVNSKDICVGGEALLRWNHPIAGFIYPPLIIKLAREQGILHKLEELIMDTACSAIATIQRQIDYEFKISINLTNGSLEWDGFEECLDKCVEKYNIPNNRLWLEITENDAISSSINTIEKIKNIKSKGHKFLIDDFGMGHTSLLYLQTNYFDVLKLDGILTRDILENKRNSEIVSSIAYLSRSLNFDIIAEYVATPEQRDELAEIGCYAFQGDLYSRPIGLEKFIEWMKNHSGKVEEECQLS